MPKKVKVAEPELVMPVHEEVASDAARISDVPDAPDIPDVPETPLPEKETAAQSGNTRQDFYGLDFHKLDKNLSTREREAWNALYASYRSGSLLTGTVSGVDTVSVGGIDVYCLVVFEYRVKVLIPHSEIWREDAEARSTGTLRRYLGAEIDYVITEIDRMGGLALASRRRALEHKRWLFDKRPPKTGDLVTCRVLAVAMPRMVVEYSGYEVSLPANDVTYGTVMDLREDYAAGQTVEAVVKDFTDGKLSLSVKEVNPHPFDGAEQRHPKGSHRLCRIMGKYAGGLFCELEKGFTCMCVYSRSQKDSDFHLGDKVLVVIKHYDYENKLVYGKIKIGL